MLFHYRKLKNVFQARKYLFDVYGDLRIVTTDEKTVIICKKETVICNNVKCRKLWSEKDDDVHKKEIIGKISRESCFLASTEQC